MMFELEGIPEEMARRAMELAAAKLPVATQFIIRANQLG
jgi:large subunit ribosomal protein L16